MYRNFDGSRALVSSPLRNLAASSHFVLVATLLWGVIVATAPAQAARPTDPYEAYIGVDTGGSDPEDDRYISTRFGSEGGPYLLESFHGTLSPHGLSHSSAQISEARIGNVYLNPDLHARVSGEAKSVGNLSGSMDATVEASFRDILTIKGLPPGASPYPFEMDFTFEGTLVGTGDKRSASRGWANVAMNFSLSNLADPTIRAFSNAALSTLPVGEAPFGYAPGVNGQVTGPLDMELSVKEGTRLMIEGSIDMYGNATGGDRLGAIFNANFSNSVRFGGIHIYTDDTRTTELSGYTIESAFGFDYRVNAVPEPASLSQLAIVGVLLGALRRKGLVEVTIETSPYKDIKEL